MCLAVFAQPALGTTIYFLTGLPALWSDSTAKYAMIETTSAWGWTHTIVLRNFKEQTSFSQMWSTLQLAELQNSIKLDFLGRTGLWQWKTNQNLETWLKFALKHVNRPELVSKSQICLLLPSFLPFLYHILYSASSSSLGLIGMSEFLHFFWHPTAQAWFGMGLTGTCPGTSYHGPLFLAGRVGTLQPQLLQGTSHRVLCASCVLQCNNLCGVAATKQLKTCWPGECGQSLTSEHEVHDLLFGTYELPPVKFLCFKAVK